MCHKFVCKHRNLKNGKRFKGKIWPNCTIGNLIIIPVKNSDANTSGGIVKENEILKLNFNVSFSKSFPNFNKP